MMKAKSNLPKKLNYMFESSDEAILPYANTVDYVKKNVRFLPIINNLVNRFKKVPKTTLLQFKIIGHTYLSHCAGYNDLDLLANANNL